MPSDGRHFENRREAEGQEEEVTPPSQETPMSQRVLSSGGGPVQLQRSRLTNITLLVLTDLGRFLSESFKVSLTSLEGHKGICFSGRPLVRASQGDFEGLSNVLSDSTCWSQLVSFCHCLSVSRKQPTAVHVSPNRRCTFYGLNVNEPKLTLTKY